MASHSNFPLQIKSEDLSEQYRQVIYDFHRDITKLRITSVIACGLLKKFPKVLPETLSEAGRLTSIDRNEETVSMKIPADYFDKPENEDFFHAIVTNYMMPYALNYFVEPDFATTILSEELVMIVTIFDAFMENTMTTVCKADSKVAKSVASTLRLSKSSFESIASNFSRRSYKRQSELLEQVCNIKIDAKGKSRIFHVAENVRHIIVHNSSRIDQRFLDSTNYHRYKKGKIFPITDAFVRRVSNATDSLAGTIHEGVRRQYLK